MILVKESKEAERSDTLFNIGDVKDEEKIGYLQEVYHQDMV